MLTARRLHTEVLREDRDFGLLEEEWDDLYRDSPLATPFQSWAWLYSWWQYYGKEYDLRLVALRCDDLLVGLMPLMLERRWGLSGRLLFIGNGLTDCSDVLVRGGWEAPVAEAGTEALRRMGSWQVADLQELRPDAAAWGLFRAWSGARTHISQSNCPAIDAKPWDELLMSLTTKQRSDVRRTLRRAEKDGVVCTPAITEDVEGAARRFVGLHREMWRGRGINPEHVSEEFESHMVAAVGRLTARGQGGVFEFRRDGEVIAAQFLVFGGGLVAEHLFGANQEAVRRYQVSSLNIWNAVNVARSKNSAQVSLLRGEEPYKLRWASELTPNYRVILSEHPTLARLYLASISLRSEAKRYRNSEGAPRWTRGLTQRSNTTSSQ